MEYKLEVCLDSAESAIIADKAGADRVELCENLFGGGTTPSAGTIKIARESVSLGLHVIIRPRPGDFCYSETEFKVMLEDIKYCRNMGVDGIVIGVLKEDGTVDMERNAALIREAGTMSITFHRAFDVTADPYKALEDIIQLGCHRILTSGQEASVLEGADLIRDIIKKADGRIIIMPGGDITERKLQKIVNETGASEYHIYLDQEKESAMRYCPDHVYMGGLLRKPEFMNSFTSSARVGSALSTLSRK
ncbi:copper homeostasis protein CutC [Oceanispirochaeta crateris]|jgi:copper homeostasis protein|uniref:PF03932 family protein CutC n=1 Tax=Oceanispirochaeta crateris TaxID=2518645 RepID=A0A5C1QSJ3_9SPIO|nr:copper homeostasis protein CutC [Oceanispirochaeta crateris]QEN09566.1 copper homeostasis protein CutC [Oceanispirochaeta crateris]